MNGFKVGDLVQVKMKSPACNSTHDGVQGTIAMYSPGYVVLNVRNRDYIAATYDFVNWELIKIGEPTKQRKVKVSSRMSYEVRE